MGSETRCPSRNLYWYQCVLGQGHSGAHQRERPEQPFGEWFDEDRRMRAYRDARVLTALNAAIERSSARREMATEMWAREDGARHDRLLAAIDKLTDRLVAFVEEDE